MKKRLLISFLMITASLAYAGAGCGDSCDKDSKDEKAGAFETSVIVAGDNCGKNCGGDKTTATEEAGHTAIDTQLAGESCGKNCGDKKAETETSDFQSSHTELAGNCGAGCDKDKEAGEASDFSASDYAVA